MAIPTSPPPPNTGTTGTSAIQELGVSQESTDIYGGHTDVDLYNQTPTAYGTLYLLKDFGGNLQNSSIDIDWMSTDLYSYTTVMSPLDSDDVTFDWGLSTLEFQELLVAPMATQDVLLQYMGSSGATVTHPGLIIGASLVYTPGAENTTWEDSGLDETGVLYGIISLRGGNPNAASMEEWGEPFDWDAYDAQGAFGAWSSAATLEAPYISYDPTLELPHLSYKFGFGAPGSAGDYSADSLSTFLEELNEAYVANLAQKIVADEIPNQIINNVIDYGTIKKSQLSTFATTEALQSGIETTTSTQEYESS